MWVSVPPRFLVELKSQSVIPKSTVTLRSVFEGTPPFAVEWFKDDIKLLAGVSCTISLEKYSSSFELNAVEAIQSGVYSCRVSNEAGTITNTAELLVKGWTFLFFVQHHHSFNPSFFFIFYHSSVFIHSYLSSSRDIHVVFEILFLPSQYPITCLHPASFQRCSSAAMCW